MNQPCKNQVIIQWVGCLLCPVIQMLGFGDCFVLVLTLERWKESKVLCNVKLTSLAIEILCLFTRPLQEAKLRGKLPSAALPNVLQLFVQWK